MSSKQTPIPAPRKPIPAPRTPKQTPVPRPRPSRTLSWWAIHPANRDFKQPSLAGLRGEELAVMQRKYSRWHNLVHKLKKGETRFAWWDENYYMISTKMKGHTARFDMRVD